MEFCSYLGNAKFIFTEILVSNLTEGKYMLDLFWRYFSLDDLFVFLLIADYKADSSFPVCQGRWGDIGFPAIEDCMTGLMNYVIILITSVTVMKLYNLSSDLISYD